MYLNDGKSARLRILSECVLDNIFDVISKHLNLHLESANRSANWASWVLTSPLFNAIVAEDVATLKYRRPDEDLNKIYCVAWFKIKCREQRSFASKLT